MELVFFIGDMSGTVTRFALSTSDARPQWQALKPVPFNQPLETFELSRMHLTLIPILFVWDAFPVDHSDHAAFDLDLGKFSEHASKTQERGEVGIQDLCCDFERLVGL